MLYKVREYVSIRNLNSIYHAIFDCHLNFTNTVWVQNKTSLNHLFLLQKKALRIISFECRNAYSNPLFYRHEIVKLLKITFLSGNLLILIFHQFSIISLPFSQTLICMRGFLIKSQYSKYQEIWWKALISAISSWNDIQKYLSSVFHF